MNVSMQFLGILKWTMHYVHFFSDSSTVLGCEGLVTFFANFWKNGWWLESSDLFFLFQDFTSNVKFFIGIQNESFRWPNIVEWTGSFDLGLTLSRRVLTWCTIFSDDESRMLLTVTQHVSSTSPLLLMSCLHRIYGQYSQCYLPNPVAVKAVLQMKMFVHSHFDISC